MLTIKCSCGVPFSINRENIIRKNIIACPNCDTEIPEQILNGLKQIVSFEAEGAYRGNNFIGRKFSLEFTEEYLLPPK